VFALKVIIMVCRPATPPGVALAKVAIRLATYHNRIQHDGKAIFCSIFGGKALGQARL
jgi:hypothetical protein